MDGQTIEQKLLHFIHLEINQITNNVLIENMFTKQYLSTNVLIIPQIQCFMFKILFLSNQLTKINFLHIYVTHIEIYAFY